MNITVKVAVIGCLICVVLGICIGAWGEYVLDETSKRRDMVHQSRSGSQCRICAKAVC